jgi:hypothetical protein
MYLDSDSHSQALARLSACQFTVSTVFLELKDPCDSERRADLLIAVEDLLTEVLQLNNAVKEMTWSLLDKKAHPSATE